MIFYQKLRQKLSLLSDWKLIYKLVTFSILALAFLLGIIFGVFLEFWYVSPDKPHLVNIPRLYNLNVLLSFWSVQTNLIVLGYFWFAIYHHRREQQFRTSNLTTLINITIYLTLTMVLFWVLVFAGLGNANANLQKYHFASKMDELVTITTHAITPVLTLIYLSFEIGKVKITKQQFIVKHVIILLIYPVAYLVYVNLRAKLLLADNMINEFLFPYPFINFYNPMITHNLILNDILIVVIGISMLLFLACFFVISNNVIYWKRRKMLAKTANLLVPEFSYQ